MTAPEQPSSNTPSIQDELEKIGISDPALTGLVADIENANSKQAAAKVWRMWNWPSVLQSFLYGLQLKASDYVKLQSIYVEYGLCPMFFDELEDVIKRHNLGLSPTQQIKTSYRKLSESFDTMLLSALENSPEIHLSDAQVDELKLRHLSSGQNDEKTLQKWLTKEFQGSRYRF